MYHLAFKNSSFLLIRYKKHNQVETNDTEYTTFYGRLTRNACSQITDPDSTMKRRFTPQKSSQHDYQLLSASDVEAIFVDMYPWQPTSHGTPVSSEMLARTHSESQLIKLETSDSYIIPAVLA